MSTLNAEQLDKLFQGYGFTPEMPDKNVRVYLRTSGYFHNAEIVPLAPDAPVERVQRDFQKGGYACKVSTFQSVEHAGQLLFTGFFQQKATTDRLRGEYKAFCAKTTRALGSPYEYINAPFLRDGQPPADASTITEAVGECLRRSGPVLVFLEAAAGFGKTCAVFDILRSLLDSEPAQNPILAELQRNRQARIFRYVLLDEMDRNYQACGLSSEMVEREIKSGRIPLIIDGFDELLHLDREGDAGGGFSEVEPMLRTLSGILESEAKVIVTTRRTAVMGEPFENWLVNLVEDGRATASRFTLQAPRIEDWVGADRRHALEQRNFPLHALANPVLLAFVRNVGDAEFSTLCNENTGLVSKYFDSLLERERVRQELPLSTEKQLEILRTIADSMLTNSASSLPREDLRRLVLEKHHAMLADALRSASEIAAKTPEELADKLTDHALLDRRTGTTSGIGFVNDFVAGTLFGLAMLDRPLVDWFDESEMDKAVTSFRFRDAAEREALWNRLRESSGAVEWGWQIRFDLQLRGRLLRALSDCLLQDLTFPTCSIGADHTLQDVVFMRCSFSGVVFHPIGMTNVGFVGCSFWDCTVDGQLGVSHAWFDRHCVEKGGTVTVPASDESAREPDEGRDGDDYTRIVLEQFWPPGRQFAKRVLQVRTLYQGVATHTRHQVQEAIDGLRADGVITIGDKMARLDINQIGRVRGLLGR